MSKGRIIYWIMNGVDVIFMAAVIAIELMYHCDHPKVPSLHILLWYWKLNLTFVVYCLLVGVAKAEWGK